MNATEVLKRMEQKNLKLPTRETPVLSWEDWMETVNSNVYNIHGLNHTFTCSGHNLTSLHGSPEFCFGYFDCNDNKLTDLYGAPNQILGDFYCENNELISLDGVPRVINGDFKCQKNKLTNLKDIHKKIDKINGLFDLTENPITSNILGLLLIYKLTIVNGDSPAFDIINRHLKGDRDVLACQEELISNGFKEFAKL